MIVGVTVGGTIGRKAEQEIREMQPQGYPGANPNLEGGESDVQGQVAAAELSR